MLFYPISAAEFVPAQRRMSLSPLHVRINYACLLSLLVFLVLHYHVIFHIHFYLFHFNFCQRTYFMLLREKISIQYFVVTMGAAYIFNVRRFRSLCGCESESRMLSLLCDHITFLNKRTNTRLFLGFRTQYLAHRFY